MDASHFLFSDGVLREPAHSKCACHFCIAKHSTWHDLDPLNLKKIGMSLRICTFLMTFKKLTFTKHFNDFGATHRFHDPSMTPQKCRMSLRIPSFLMFWCPLLDVNQKVTSAGPARSASFTDPLSLKHPYHTSWPWRRRPL